MEISLREFDTGIAKKKDKKWGNGIIPDRIHVFIGRRGSGEFHLADHV